MVRALGTLLKVKKDEQPSRYSYYMSLPDLLMDIVERDPGCATVGASCRTGALFRPRCAEGGRPSVEITLV